MGYLAHHLIPPCNIKACQVMIKVLLHVALMLKKNAKEKIQDEAGNSSFELWKCLEKIL